MKEIIGNLFGFLYTLSMGDYIFFFLTFVLILLFIYMLLLLKKLDETKEIDDIETIKENIEKEYKPTTITLTEYETEQERNAIISYEELIKNKDKFNVSYDEEYVSDTEEISVKKISLEETNYKEETKSNINVKLMNYDSEEAFLTALKQLQHNLIN